MHSLTNVDNDHERQNWVKWSLGKFGPTTFGTRLGQAGLGRRREIQETRGHEERLRVKEPRPFSPYSLLYIGRKSGAWAEGSDRRVTGWLGVDPHTAHVWEMLLRA